MLIFSQRWQTYWLHSVELLFTRQSTALCRSFFNSIITEHYWQLRAVKCGGGKSRSRENLYSAALKRAICAHFPGHKKEGPPLRRTMSSRWWSRWVGPEKWRWAGILVHRDTAVICWNPRCGSLRGNTGQALESKEHQVNTESKLLRFFSYWTGDMHILRPEQTWYQRNLL